MTHGVHAQADVEASVYHTSRLVSTAALDLMTTQRDLIYTARAETRLKIHPKDKAALGITVARLVEEGGPPTKVILSSLSDSIHASLPLKARCFQQH